MTNVNSLFISINSIKAAYLINFSIFIDFRWWAFKWKLYVFIIASAFYLFILVYILLFNTFHLHILCQCFSPPRLPSLQLFLSLPFPVHQYSSPPPLPQFFLCLLLPPPSDHLGCFHTPPYYIIISGAFHYHLLFFSKVGTREISRQIVLGIISHCLCQRGTNTFKYGDLMECQMRPNAIFHKTF